MPPKRRPPASASATKAASASAATPKKRASKLAKENDITADQESEILEAFALFSTKPDTPSSSADDDNDKQGVIATSDVRRCLIALNTPASNPSELSEILETVDPTDSGYVTYPHFLAVAALKLHARNNGDEDPEARGQEVDRAFELFTRGEGEFITLAHLRRVARELREDVGDAVLRDMIREATSSAGPVVGKDDFEDVMRRAGVFG